MEGSPRPFSSALLQRVFKLSQLFRNGCIFFGFGPVLCRIEHGAFQVFLEMGERRFFDGLGCVAGPEVNKFGQAVVKFIERFKVDPIAAFIKHFFFR